MAPDCSRRVKPSNVLVTTYHEPALTDFGIAGHIADVAGESDVRISYPWSPPELLDGRSNGSVASDVYSLGATIWHLLVGRSPFSIPAGDNSTRALSARILHAAPPATQRSDVPPALDRLLQQCLAKNPAHRPQSALELARSLQQIEAAANWSRTAVAVEGDRPDSSVRTPGPEPEEDRTVMKAVTVISASAPRRVAAAQTEPETEPEPEKATSALVWAVIGLVAAAGLVAALIFTNGDRDDPRPIPTPTADTPSPLIVDSLTQPPSLSGERSGNTVVFRWESQDGVETGDEWIWQQTGTDGFERTRKLVVRLESPDEVCLEVRQVRGSDESPTAYRCVP